ncbi:DNA-directed RNA polymerase subunit omega [bacterium]|nr:DNA-directed RNA polymerase subunit omega [bacterium]
MGFVSIERVTQRITNKYEAVLVAAKEARVQNSIAQLKDLDPNSAYPKITSLSLQRLIEGKIRYSYGELETPPPSPETEQLDLEEGA